MWTFPWYLQLDIGGNSSWVQFREVNHNCRWSSPWPRWTSGCQPGNTVIKTYSITITITYSITTGGDHCPTPGWSCWPGGWRPRQKFVVLSSVKTLHNACTVFHCSLHSHHIATNCLQDNNIVPTGILEVRHKLLQSCIVTLFKGPYVVSSCPFCQDDNQVLRQETDQLTTSSNQVLLLVGVPVSGILLSGHGNSHHMVPNTHRQNHFCGISWFWIEMFS